MALTGNFASALLPLIDTISACGTDFSKLIYDKAFVANDFNKNHTVLTGLKDGAAVPIVAAGQNYNTIPFVDDTNCAANECDINPNFSGKKLDHSLMECRIPICLRTFDAKFMAFWNQYRWINPNTDKTEKEYLNTALIAFLKDLALSNLNGAKWRGAYFGDKSSSDPLIDGIDGYRVQALAGSNKVDSVNSLATGQDIYDTLVAMEQTKIGSVWSDGQQRIVMSYSDAQKLAAYLNTSKDSECCQGITKLNPDGVSKDYYAANALAFHGVPIIGERAFDGIYAQTTVVDNNTILWTTKENSIVATPELETLSMFDVWHDRTDKKIYMEVGAYYDAKLALDDYVIADATVTP